MTDLGERDGNRAIRTGKLDPSEGQVLGRLLSQMATVVKDDEVQQVMEQIALLRAKLDGTDEHQSETVTILPPPAKRLGSH